MKTFGEKLRELREAKDLSLRELARNLGVSAAFLSDVELGRRHPSEAVLKKLARALRVPVEELRKHDTRPPVADLKRRAAADPAFGLALRRVMDKEISSEELLDLVRKKAEEEPAQEEE